MDNLVVMSMHAAPSPDTDRNEGALHPWVPHTYPEIPIGIDHTHSPVGVDSGSVQNSAVSSDWCPEIALRPLFR